MKKIIISAGPIPGRLDSIKYITNRFKGGLAFKTAELLSKDFDVTIIKWKYCDYEGELKTIDIEDVDEYMNYMTTNKYDAYILAGAVANLVPIDPWVGKFPSHNYKVGEEFNIKFTIAPRIIDEIKKNFPHSTLIGYKLFDGTENELIDAGWETLINSKSNAIFCNHPKTAKSKKVMILPDGSIHKMNFDEHIKKIIEIINIEWYTTKAFDIKDLSVYETEIKKLSKLLEKIKIKKEPYEFGTVAYKLNDGILTTTRGKKENGFCKIFHVNHAINRIYSTNKATLNAPFLELLFFDLDGNIILHGHKQLKNVETLPYIFDGTKQYFNIITYIVDKKLTTFNIKNHGYYKIFSSF